MEPPKAFMNGSWYRLDESRAITYAIDPSPAKVQPTEGFLRSLWKRLFRR